MADAVILGIDFGATNLKAVVATPNGAMLERISLPSLVSDGPDRTLERIAKLALDTKARWPLDAIGIGLCGPVNRGSGTLISSPVLPGWFDVPVAATLVEQTTLPVVVDNDANCAILGEWWLGAGEQRDVVAGLTLGTGVGGGLVVRGETFYGSAGWAGEFGHISLADEPPCPCGGRGCLGRLASVTATLNRYHLLSGNGASGTDDLVGRAKDGDLHASEALAVTVDYLIRATRILINVLNPSVFILAGGMAGWGVALSDAVQSGLRKTTFDGLDRTPIRLARLGAHSGALGAVRLAVARDRR